MRVPLYLDIAGRSFGGWVRVRIERSVDSACIQFGVGATRSWPGLEEDWWLQTFDRVEVRIYDFVICTGYIDRVAVVYDGQSHDIELSGRGLVSDLVDCSYVGEPRQWKSGDPAEIIRTIAAQHDIEVTIDADLGEPLDFQIQQGEECWAAIERLTRLRQVLAYEEPDGSLLITRGSDEFLDTRLIQGENILRAVGTLDDKDRYSDYIVKGQQKSPKGAADDDADEIPPEVASFSVGEVKDESVPRFRPLLLVQSANTDNDNALERANWEKQNRWGKARKAEITVADWLMPDGSGPWPINRMVEVEDAWMGLDRQLAITAATWDVSSEGLRTTLTLQPPEALTPEPQDAEKSTEANSGKGKSKSGGGAGGPSFWDQVAADRVQGEARRREAKQ